MKEHIRVLAVKPDHERFTKAFGGYMTVAGGEIGLMLLPKNTLALSPDVTVRSWQELRPSGSSPLIVQLMFDTKMPGSWVSVHGSTEAKRIALLAVLDDLLPIVRLEDLKRKARGSKDPSALTRLALALDDRRDAEATRILLEGLASKKGAVRTAAASAMGMLHWSSFSEAISKALSVESDDSVRRVLVAALEACRETELG